jgi:hypothetical protein
MAPPRDRYQIVVAQRSYVPSIWDWEIYRDGEPLPARLQGSGLRSEVAAKAAGKAALSAFLDALEQEQK